MRPAPASSSSVHLRPRLRVVAQRSLIAEGDKVVARLTITGTHQGTFLDMPPTRKKFAMPAIDILRFRDGKAIEHWGVSDQAAMMQQLGAIPA